MHSTKVPVIPEIAKLIEKNSAKAIHTHQKTTKKTPKRLWLRLKRTFRLPSFDLDIRNEFNKKMIDDLES